MVSTNMTKSKRKENEKGCVYTAIMNVISGSSTSLRYTKQLNLNGYIGANIKGRVLQIVGNLNFELAMLATKTKIKRK